MSIKNKIKNILYYMPRTSITKIRYFYSTGKKLNLRNPKDFNQKILYLMLNECEEIKKCVDKYLVRDYVQEKGLGEILINLYGKYENVNDIDFKKLPNEYVLKTNHGCGCTIIKNKNTKLNEENIKKDLKDSLRLNYAKQSLEYQYADIKPCIICEEYLKENEKKMPNDYKIFCFNGKAKFLLACEGRDYEIKKIYYDMFWKKLECTKEKQKFDIIKPKNFDNMIKIAEKLAEDFKFVRVDLYNIDGKIYFGELTFTPRGGINNTIKQEYLDKWGQWLDLGKN